MTSPWGEAALCNAFQTRVNPLAGITVSPSLKWTPSISLREKGFAVDSCPISAFMLWPMRLAQTTWKPSGALQGGGVKEHLRWTLWPTSSGVITGRDGRGGTAAEKQKAANEKDPHEEFYLIKSHLKTFYMKKVSVNINI